MMKSKTYISIINQAIRDLYITLGSTTNHEEQEKIIASILYLEDYFNLKKLFAEFENVSKKL